MRLHIRFQLEESAAIPADHHYELLGLVYRLLETSDAGFATFLHKDGYRETPADSKLSKLFTFSGLRTAAQRRRLESGRLSLSPGPIDWYLASPREDFLAHSATGMLSAGTMVEVGAARLRLESVEGLPDPAFSERTVFTCLSPIVCARPLEGGRTYYLRPTDPLFSEAVRENLLWKHSVLHGFRPDDDGLTLQFDPAYLSDPKRRGGTKLITFKNIQMVGAFAPFTLTGSPALKRIAWQCGLGEKNSIGMGMIDLK